MTEGMQAALGATFTLLAIGNTIKTVAYMFDEVEVPNLEIVMTALEVVAFWVAVAVVASFPTVS